MVIQTYSVSFSSIAYMYILLKNCDFKKCQKSEKGYIIPMTSIVGGTPDFLKYEIKLSTKDVKKTNKQTNDYLNPWGPLLLRFYAR